MKAASIIAAISFIGALVAIALFADAAHAREPDCPSSWPEEPAEQFFADAEGAEWFVIRSADSNGYETVRAYRADDGYQAGYAPGSPDEICYLLVRRAGSSEDVPDAQQVVFRAEQEPEETAPAISKTLFREFYDRLIPVGPYGANPDPKWGDLFGVFSNEERSCIIATFGEERVIAVLGEEGLATALQNSVFHEGDEPRLEDVLIYSCLSDDTAPILTFALAFAGALRQADPGEQYACVQKALQPAVAALSKPFPTEEDLIAVFASFFALASCGLESTDTSSGAPGE
ncbi:MAG: hypothetical protein OXF79_14395 [Chloroflexi bacterium]|nr:hypothetical protein [Chloroflexota bacterium]